MYYRSFIVSIATLALALNVSAATLAVGPGNNVLVTEQKNRSQKQARVAEPLNLAVLVQDDLISQVGNELGVLSATESAELETYVHRRSISVA